MTKQQEERFVKAIESIAKTMVNQDKRAVKALKKFEKTVDSFIEKMSNL